MQSYTRHLKAVIVRRKCSTEHLNLRKRIKGWTKFILRSFMIHTIHQILLGWLSRIWCVGCGMHHIWKKCKTGVGKPQSKTPLGRPKSRWK